MALTLNDDVLDELTRTVNRAIDRQRESSIQLLSLRVLHDESLRRAGRIDEALQQAEAALKVALAAHGTSHPIVASLRADRIASLLAAGRPVHDEQAALKQLIDGPLAECTLERPRWQAHLRPTP
jgi:hypothetical protein